MLLHQVIMLPDHAGDQASHLLWRLRRGDTFTRHPPAVAVVMIGTNDLGAAACLGGQAAITRAANGTAARCGAGWEGCLVHATDTFIVCYMQKACTASRQPNNLCSVAL